MFVCEARAEQQRGDRRGGGPDGVVGVLGTAYYAGSAELFERTETLFLLPIRPPFLF